jgi:hypothetical protein
MSRTDRFLVRTAALCAAAALAAAVAWAGADDAAYVDCSAADNGDGTLEHPWRTLAQANAVALAPGERLLLRRGVSCAGTLAPTGSGTAAQPIVVGAYGSGSRARIDGAGEDAVVLRNTSHLVLQDLEVTNRGTAEARRRGVHVVADGELVQDVTVSGLYVHDVDGDLAKDSNGSGGIQVDVRGGGRFAGLIIERNRIADVSRSGIFVVAGSGTRPRAGEPWPGASTDVVVRQNRLARLGGDGIVALGTVGAVLEDNVVSTGNLRGFDYADPDHVCNAGIWTFNANDTLIQRNEVFDMRFNGCDGTAFDIDYQQDGTIVQDNYSHDNAGGFILLCTDAQPRRAEVRFNLSLDDAFAATTAPCAFPQTGTYEGVRFYNNTIVGATPLLGFEGQVFGALFDPENLEFHNNLLVATQPLATSFPCGARCSNNLFFGLPPSGTSASSADPALVAPRRRGRGRLSVASSFRLRFTSPAIGAGVPVPGTVERDYFGRRFAPTLPPAIGFYQP